MCVRESICLARALGPISDIALCLGPPAPKTNKVRSYCIIISALALEYPVPASQERSWISKWPLKRWNILACGFSCFGWTFSTASRHKTFCGRFAVGLKVLGGDSESPKGKVKSFLFCYIGCVSSMLLSHASCNFYSKYSWAIGAGKKPGEGRGISAFSQTLAAGLLLIFCPQMDTVDLVIVLLHFFNYQQ